MSHFLLSFSKLFGSAYTSSNVFISHKIDEFLKGKYENKWKSTMLKSRFYILNP